MSVQTGDYLDAVTHLPPGGRLTFYDVAWDEYEQLLAQLDDRVHLRISYNQGRLEIMSPSAKHEKYKNLLHDLAMIQHTNWPPSAAHSQCSAPSGLPNL